MLPFSSMLDVKQAVRMESTKAVPQFKRLDIQPPAAGTVDPMSSCLQIYTSDMLLHNFYDVCLVDSFATWFEMVVAQWRVEQERVRNESLSALYEQQRQRGQRQ